MANRKTRVQTCAILGATVTALLEFLYKRMPLHLVYTITMLVCEKLKVTLQSERLSLNLPCGSEDLMTSSQSLYRKTRINTLATAINKESYPTKYLDILNKKKVSLHTIYDAPH